MLVTPPFPTITVTTKLAITTTETITFTDPETVSKLAMTTSETVTFADPETASKNDDVEIEQISNLLFSATEAVSNHNTHEAREKALEACQRYLGYGTTDPSLTTSPEFLEKSTTLLDLALSFYILTISNPVNTIPAGIIATAIQSCNPGQKEIIEEVKFYVTAEIITTTLKGCFSTDEGELSVENCMSSEVFAAMVKAAADSGRKVAQFALGKMYAAGIFSHQIDLKLARKYLQLSADQGYSSAKDALFNLPETTFEQSQRLEKTDTAQAYKLCKQAAEEGDVEAIFRLGQYLLDNGTKFLAIKEFYLAAEKGHKDAKSQIEKIVSSLIVSSLHADEAIILYDRACFESTDLSLYLARLLGKRFLAIGDRRQARLYFDKAGHKGSELELGDIFAQRYNDSPVKRARSKWYNKAVAFYKQAGTLEAKKKSAEFQSNDHGSFDERCTLGKLCLELSKNTLLSPKEKYDYNGRARYVLCQAASRGHHGEAAYIFADILTKDNYPQSAINKYNQIAIKAGYLPAILEKAAANGDLDAAIYLEKLHRNGNEEMSLPVDLEKAKKYSDRVEELKAQPKNLPKEAFKNFTGQLASYQ